MTSICTLVVIQRSRGQIVGSGGGARTRVTKVHSPVQEGLQCIDLYLQDHAWSMQQPLQTLSLQKEYSNHRLKSNQSVDQLQASRIRPIVPLVGNSALRNPQRVYWAVDMSVCLRTHVHQDSSQIPSVASWIHSKLLSQLWFGTCKQLATPLGHYPWKWSTLKCNKTEQLLQALWQWSHATQQHLGWLPSSFS